MASCTEDSIVPHVIPFVKEHLVNAEWAYRDAAVMALGSIMEGPDSDTLTSLLVETQVHCMLNTNTLMCTSSENLCDFNTFPKHVYSTYVHMAVLGLCVCIYLLE